MGNVPETQKKPDFRIETSQRYGKQERMARCLDEMMRTLESIAWGGPSTGSMISDDIRGNEFEAEIIRVRKLAEGALNLKG